VLKLKAIWCWRLAEIDAVETDDVETGDVERGDMETGDMERGDVEIDDVEIDGVEIGGVEEVAVGEECWSETAKPTDKSPSANLLTTRTTSNIGFTAPSISDRIVSIQSDQGLLAARPRGM